MSRSKTIILRVQSPDGTKRIELSESDSTCKLYEKVHDTFDLRSFAFSLYKERNKKLEISSSKTRTVCNVGLRHGDMIFMSPLDDANLFSPGSSEDVLPNTHKLQRDQSMPSGSSLNNFRNSESSGNKSNSVKEDDVDLLLYQLDGKIKRNRDLKLSTRTTEHTLYCANYYYGDKLGSKCSHNSHSRCVHCSALEPFDDSYLKEHNIKHLSFHSYLRKMTSGVDKGKFLALEDVTCSIRDGCKDHPPWPKGICSKCQPNAITLNRQVYRHVDNITFENKGVVERFLNYWRTSGHQRIGFLYGTYDIYNDVPLGVRANVVAIYEPPQESGRDYVQVLKDEKEEIVEHLAQTLGFQRIGWIFTDLLPEDVQTGTVKHLRDINSHFLSAEECIMAGHYQNLHPNPCKYSSTNYFGSKFVTVCVTGDTSNQVHMEGYQVSNQCMALVRDKCLLPTKDAPELGYVRESSDKQFVPDVYYKEKDTYGNEVSRLARPLPVEYLLVDVPASTPLTPVYTFNMDPAKEPFPVENRLTDADIQDFNALNHYLSQFSPEEFFTAISDFHLLLYIATMDMLPMKEYMGPLLQAIKDKDIAKALSWSKSEHWATIEQLIAASSPLSSRSGSLTSGAANAASGPSSNILKWTCPHCTFLNTADVSNCEMCSLPRSSNH